MMADRSDRHTRTRAIAMVGFEGFQILDVTGPLEVFSRASRLLLEHLKRGGGSSQFSPSLQAPAEAADNVFGALSGWIRDHLADDLSVDRLAARMEMSPRHLGVSPFTYRARVQRDAAGPV